MYFLLFELFHSNAIHCILRSFLSTLLALSQPFTWTNICTFRWYDLCELAIETQFSPIVQYVCVYTRSYCHGFQLVYAVYSLIFFFSSYVLCYNTMHSSYCFRSTLHTHPCTGTRIHNALGWMKEIADLKAIACTSFQWWCAVDMVFFLFNSNPFARCHCFDKIVFIPQAFYSLNFPNQFLYSNAYCPHQSHL